MESQSSVGKRIIWAVSMVVLCTFLTFFMSMFCGSAFPELNIIYKAGIPALVLVALGVAGFSIQSFFMPFVNDLNIPDWIRKAMPILLIGLGILMGQFAYDEFAGEVLKNDIFNGFILDGVVYETTAFGFQSIYQSGLDLVTVLLGNTVFAVSCYNRFYLVLSAVLIYFSLKNICGGKTFAANLFLALFFLAKQSTEFSIIPDCTLVYLVLVSVFLLSVSLVYYFRTKTTNPIAQVISVFVMGCLFAILFICEANSLILALPAIVVSFSGKQKQDKRWYYILAVEGLLLILITSALVFVLKPEFLLNFSFELPTVEAVDLKTTTILVLNILGFLGVFGMWKQKLFYIIPGFLGIYFMFTTRDFVSGINGEFICFLCFAFYAALGVGLLDDSKPLEIEEKEETLEEEFEEEEYEETIQTTVKENVPLVAVADKQVQDEIASIKAMNEKLNQVETGFVPLEFKKPKEREKKVVDYAYEPTVEEMKYDIEVSDDDDFDI